MVHLVSIVSWSKTANGCSVLILDQSLVIILWAAGTYRSWDEKGGKATYFIYVNRRALCSYVVIKFANGLKI